MSPRYIKPVVRQVDKTGGWSADVVKYRGGDGETDLALSCGFQSRRVSRRDGFRLGGMEGVAPISRIARQKARFIYPVVAVIISHLINGLLEVNALTGAIIVPMDFED